jgi:hypothetical protein
MVDQLMGSMGGAGGGGAQSSSQQSSQGESIARQALFYPTPTGIYQSSRAIQGAADRAIAPLAPFTEASEEALNELRLLTGLTPRDPMAGFSDDLSQLMSSLNAPEAALVDPASGRYQAQQIGTGTAEQAGLTSEELAAANPAFAREYIESLGGGPTEGTFGQFPSDAHAGPATGRFKPGGLGPESGRVPGSSVTLPEGGGGEEGGASFNLLFSGLANEPQSFIRRTQADSLTDYTFSSETNTNYINDALRIAHTAMTDLEGELDPEERQRLYNRAISSFDQADARMDQVVAGVFHGDARAVGVREMQGKLNSLRAEMENKFTTEGPRALTEEEIEERVKKQPAYQFRFQEGMTGVENSLIARGLMESGRAAKEMTRFGQGFASNEFQNIIGNLMGIVGQGQPALQQGTGVHMGLGQNLMTNIQNMNRAWEMSPWTQRSYQVAQGSSQSSSGGQGGGGGGGLGSLAGLFAGGA